MCKNNEGGFIMSDLGNKEIFSKNLRYFIEQIGITQKEFSEIIGVATSTLNDWMQAKKYPRIDKIELMANYFGILKSDLIEKPENNSSGIRAELISKLSDLSDPQVELLNQMIDNMKK